MACIIVAAGSGLRFGDAIPKQYHEIGGLAIICRAILALQAEQRIEAIQCVVRAEDRSLYDQAVRQISSDRLQPPVEGGATRAQSVLRGLLAIENMRPKRVLIHDAARPFVPKALICRVIDALEKSDAVVPGIEVADTLWKIGDATFEYVDREKLFRAQTPQGFTYSKILHGHKNNAIDATDDIVVARSVGMAPVIVAGAEGNFKITTNEDMERAQRSQNLDVRTGTGFDVHAFREGDHLVLCGIRIPHSKSLDGHSDADVAMHAITDAILGASANGDIGQWFPATDANWKGADSAIFLAKSVELVRAAGMTIGNIDCTIICEFPKIGPYANAMRQHIAAICGIEIGRVGIKATTTEGLGFTGRREGIAAMASATIITR